MHAGMNHPKLKETGMLAGLSMLVLAAAFLLMTGCAYHEYTTSEGPSQMARIAIMPQGITNPISTRMKSKNTNTTNIASLIVRPVNACIVEMPRHCAGLLVSPLPATLKSPPGRLR